MCCGKTSTISPRKENSLFYLFLFGFGKKPQPLLFYLCKYGGRFLVLGDNALVSECIKRKRFFYDVFYAFPDEEQGFSVPGFETQKNLHRSEALIKLAENKHGVCFSNELKLVGES